MEAHVALTRQYGKLMQDISSAQIQKLQSLSAFKRRCTDAWQFAIANDRQDEATQIQLIIKDILKQQLRISNDLNTMT
jgi:hypothetical protein